MLSGASSPVWLRPTTRSTRLVRQICILTQVSLRAQADQLGMDAASLTIKTATGPIRVDAPMRSINRGSHSRVHALYERLGVELRRLDFGYSFARLTDAKVPSRAAGGSGTAVGAGADEPPAYTASEDKAHCRRPVKTTQATQFIYEGSSGMRWPPLAIPSHLAPSFAHPSPLPLLRHLVHLALLALSYLHLLILAFAYVHFGLTDVRPRPGPLPSLARLAGWRHVGSEGLRGWCARHGVWSGMVDEVLVPLWAAVATVDRGTAEEMPVGEVLQYVVGTFGAAHYVAADGVRAIVTALAAPLPATQTHTNTAITSLAPTVTPTGRPRTIIRSTTNGVANVKREVDHVILATQANQARVLLETVGMVGGMSEAARARGEALGVFGYARSLVVTHSDESLLPPDARDRRDLNFASYARDPAAATATSRPPPSPSSAFNGSSDSAHQPATWIQATHIISSDPRSLILQTTNPLTAPDPALTHRTSWFERATVSPASRAALPGFLLPDSVDSDPECGDNARGGRWQGIGNVWLVGSWAADGCPLLEGCVVSAERAVGAIARREGWTAGRGASGKR